MRAGTPVLACRWSAGSPVGDFVRSIAIQRRQRLWEAFYAVGRGEPCGTLSEASQAILLIVRFPPDKPARRGLFPSAPVCGTMRCVMLSSTDGPACPARSTEQQ